MNASYQRIPTMMSLLASLVATFSAAPAAIAQDSRPATTKPAERSPEKQALEYVKMTTSLGDIVIELNREKAPITVENFLSYVGQERYDGTIFHRVIANFMIQGGGFNVDFEKVSTDPSIQNEWKNGLKNVHGSIAMARLPGQPDSATNQFFINVKDNPFLDTPQPDGAGYAVFGKVVAGMETVEAIRRTPTLTGVPGKPQLRLQHVPAQTVVIKSVRHISADDAKKLIEDTSSVETSPTSRPGS